MFSKTKTIVTHSGSFHSDEVFAVAVLDLVLKGKYELERTREREQIDQADIVVDVGGEYDVSKQRFDHHQEGGAGVRENGIPYSSIGLVWKEYGEVLCEEDAEVAEKVEKRLVQPVDALDNGMSLSQNTHEEIEAYTLHRLISTFRPTWNEPQDFDGGFKKALEIAKLVLLREIAQAKAEIEVREIVDETYKNADDKRVVVFDAYYPTRALKEYPDPLFVVHPDAGSDRFVARALSDESATDSFKNKKDFPEGWHGKTEQDLQKASGVEDATFCHQAGFIAVADSKAGAVELATRAADA